MTTQVCEKIKILKMKLLRKLEKTSLKI